MLWLTCLYFVCFVKNAADSCPSLSQPANSAGWKCVTAGSFSDVTCLSSGSTQQLLCDDGYFVNATSDVAECQGTSWANSQLSCEKRCCQDLASQLPTDVQYDGKGRCFGDMIYFSCEVGHQGKGPSSVKCGSQGYWQPNSSFPSCEPVDCGIPPKPLDPSTTAVHVDSTTYLSQANYSCVNEGYYVQVGVGVLTCTENGFWSPNSPPTCVLKSCTVSELQMIAPGATIKSDFETYYVGDNVIMSCGNIDKVITCTLDGWQGANVTDKPCRSCTYTDRLIFSSLLRRRFLFLPPQRLKK